MYVSILSLVSKLPSTLVSKPLSILVSKLPSTLVSKPLSLLVSRLLTISLQGYRSIQFAADYDH